MVQGSIRMYLAEFNVTGLRDKWVFKEQIGLKGLLCLISPQGKPKIILVPYKQCPGIRGSLNKQQSDFDLLMHVSILQNRSAECAPLSELKLWVRRRE